MGIERKCFWNKRGTQRIWSCLWQVHYQHSSSQDERGRCPAQLPSKKPSAYFSLFLNDLNKVFLIVFCKLGSRCLLLNAKKATPRQTVISLCSDIDPKALLHQRLETFWSCTQNEFRKWYCWHALIRWWSTHALKTRVHRWVTHLSTYTWFVL